MVMAPTRAGPMKSTAGYRCENRWLDCKFIFFGAQVIDH